MDDKELKEFLENINFDVQMLNAQQFYQLIEQISLLKKFVGLESKLKEVTSKQKLDPILSELNFAYNLAKLGFKIEMICDGDKRFIDNKKNRKQSPDFIALKDNNEYFVEVTKFQTSYPNEELKKHLDQEIKKYPIYFWVQFSEEYSTPCLTSDDYNLFQGKIEVLSNKIKEILPDYENMNSEVEIDGCIIYFTPLPKNEQGFIGGGVYEYLLPTEKISDSLKNRLSQKSAKSLSWDTSNKLRYYLIALDLEEFTSFSFPYGLLHLLYGKITYYNAEEFGQRKPKCYYKLKEFLDSPDFQSLSYQCKDFLFKVGFDINKESIVDELGIFISQRNEFSNVTGVLVKSHNSYQYLPNPFSTKNDSDLINFFDFPILPEG